MEWDVGNVDAIRVITIFSAVVGTLFAIGRMIKFVWRFMRRLGHALDLIIGVPAMGDAPARPGIIARVAKIETEVRPNHGSSMRDTIDYTRLSIMRANDAITRVERKLEQHIDEHHQANVNRRDEKNDSET